MIINANALHIPLVSVSVLFYSVIKVTAFIPKSITREYEFVGKALCFYGNRLSMHALERSATNNFCLMFNRIFLHIAKVKDILSNLFFYAEIWNNQSQNILGLQITTRPTIKWTTIIRTWIFFIIVTSERIRYKFNSFFVNHADLYSGMVSGCNTLLTFISLIAFYSNIGFSIHKSSNISNLNFCHSIHSYSGFMSLYHKKGGAE